MFLDVNHHRHHHQRMRKRKKIIEAKEDDPITDLTTDKILEEVHREDRLYPNPIGQTNQALFEGTKISFDL